MQIEEVFVKFVGADDVVEHIVSLKEKSSSIHSTKRRVSSAKSKESQVEKETTMEFCETIDAKHSANDLIAQANELAGSDIYTFKTPRKNILRVASDASNKDLSVQRRLSKVGFNFESLSQTPRRSVEVPSTPKSILKRTPSVRTKESSSSSNIQVSTPKQKTSDGPRKTPKRLWKRNDAEDEQSSDSGESSESEEEDDGENDEKTSKESLAKATSIASSRSTPSKQKSSAQKTPRSRRKLNMEGAATPKKTKKVVEDVNEKVSAESYFESHHSSKTTTSDRTLSRLDVPHLDPSEVVDSLSKVRFPYDDDRRSLCEGYRKLFDQWILSLHQGFNILLHGLGSKINLIEEFRAECLHGFSHVVVNGFFPSLTFKSVVSAISEVLTGNANVPANPADQLGHVKKIFHEQNFPDFFLVVHNIDGMSLRNERTQHAFSLLSKIDGFHIIASIDHINAPLLWDLTKLSRLNWLWFEAATFESYVEETSYENSMMVKQSGSLALSSLCHVMKSLTPNAKGIFLLIVKDQLDAKNESSYQGFAFADLYQLCREGFIVNSEQTLRAQLVEFKDHKLIKTKMGFDGIERIITTLENSVISIYIEQHDNQI